MSNYGYLPPSYWPLISKLKDKSEKEQDEIVARFLEEQDKKNETPLMKYVMGQIDEEEYLAQASLDVNQRLRLQSRIAERKRNAVFNAKKA